jgi:hypothetical protein
MAGRVVGLVYYDRPAALRQPKSILHCLTRRQPPVRDNELDSLEKAGSVVNRVAIVQCASPQKL